MIIGRASNSSQQGQANFLSCNPSDATIVAVGGYFMLKIMNKTDKGFGQIGTIKGDNMLVTSITWLTSEALAAGTAETELIIVESGEFKFKLRAEEIDRIDLSAETESDLTERPIAPIRKEKTKMCCV